MILNVILGAPRESFLIGSNVVSICTVRPIRLQKLIKFLPGLALISKLNNNIIFSLV